MILNIIWFYIKLFFSFLWQLPQNLIALIMLPFLGKIKLIYEKNFTFIFNCSKMKGGISLGNFIFLSSELSEKKTSILHELGHVKQSHMFSWLYLIIIGLPSILNATFHFTNCYYDFFTEKWANKLMVLKVAKNQYGCYLYIPKEK